MAPLRDKVRTRTVVGVGRLMSAAEPSDTTSGADWIAGSKKRTGRTTATATTSMSPPPPDTTEGAD